MMHGSLAAHFKKPRLYLAGALGVLSALFLYGYWLVDLLPVGSRLLVLLTVAAIILGAAFYYWLLLRSAAAFEALSASGRVLLLAVALLSGAALLFGGTSAWQAPARSVPFLLPVHRLEVKALEGAQSSGAALLWFNTSLGDVSYDTLQYRGWKRVGDQLVLQDASNNSVEWAGKTGAAVEMVWRQTGNTRLQISWDGVVQTLDSSGGKYTYSQAFAVPWYGSRAFVLALGVLVFASLMAVLSLLIWDKRASLLPRLNEAWTSTPGRLSRMDAAWIGGAGILALLLRVPDLGGQFPAVDEYFHLIAARQIIEGAALSSVYERGLWLVTLPVSLSLRIFGYQLWAARLPGLLFNVLAILPLYLLARKINRPIAALSVLLYATSPWIVTFARIAREYAYYPLYFYWIVLGMITFINRIPPGFVLPRDWREVFTTKTLVLGAALVVPPLFVFFGDRLSTFRTILLAYLVFSVFLLARFSFRDRSNRPFLGVLGAGLIFAALGYSLYQRSKIVAWPTFNSVPVSYFVPDPQQQWYYDRLVPFLLLALICAALCCILLRRINFVPLFMFTLYGGYIAFFAFFSKTFFHTRHLLTTELWFVILVAVGLYLLWRVVAALNPWRHAYVNALLAVVMGAALINWRQLVAPITSTNPDDPISEDYLHDMTQVHAFMLAHAQPGDALISTVYGLYSSWKEEPQFEASYRITTETPRDQIFALIDQHPSGWIVIDQIRLAMSNLGPREFAGNPDVEYIGLFGDESVWYWRHTAGSLGYSVVAGKGK